MINENTLKRILKVLKWSKIIAKFAAIGTTLTGAVTAASSSVTTGFALGAAGATSYAAAKNIPVNGYEKTKHIPPKPISEIDKAAQIEMALKKKQEEMKMRKNNPDARAKAAVKTYDRNMRQVSAAGNDPKLEPLTNPKTSKAHLPHDGQKTAVRPPQFIARKSVAIEQEKDPLFQE